jgi:uncharacterized protein YjaG (DUF416 family)
MAVFDKDDLRSQLGGLSKWKQVAFAASCIEVLVPSYARFAELEGVGDPGLVRTAVNAVWSGLRSSSSYSEPTDLPPSGAVRDLVPAEDDWNDWAPQAEDAVASLFYLLEFMQNDDVQFLVYVAQRAYSAVDELTARQMDLGVLDATQRSALLDAPPIQAELVRQQDAIRSLRDSLEGDESVLSRLRATSESLAAGGQL